MGSLWLVRGVENNGNAIVPLMAIVDDAVIEANIAEYQKPGFMVTISRTHVEIINLDNAYIHIVAERISDNV